MKQHLLDRVEIPVPCREDWNEMRGNAEVRFCSHCAKDVHNLSSMTRRDAERLIAKSNGRICVRYVTRADRTIVTAPETFAPLFNITRRASRLAASAFTAALTISSVAAQSTVTMNQPADAEAIVNQTNAPQIGSGNAAIVGTVLDPQGAVIPGAKVTITDAAGAVRQTETNDEGVYRVENLPGGSFTLHVQAVGFANLKITNISLSSGSESRPDIVLELDVTTETVGLLIVTSPAQSLVYHSDERATVSRDDETEQDTILLDSFNEVASGELKKVKALIISGFDVNTRWHDDATPLMVVNDEKIAKHLLQLGADVHARKVYSETVLMSASHNPEVVKVLLKAGADVHARDNFGVTPLMYAMLGYDEKSAQVLIDAGADVNARDKDHRTALMFAAIEGRVETIKVLLRAKAKYDVRDVDGKTALTFAMENNHEEAIKVLRVAGAVE
ncbi:MAG: ankyrin repeat domain-containing protein [Pyrinomonadaceae bacterium MAG19_C2-C3]|nr:ankyrin repeat domain-containing protein [Pyrinomonadaceae bacterium MAG19_C2-C3]